MAPKKPRTGTPRNTSWDPLATWYDGWVGEGGSHHHQKLAIPGTLRLLEVAPGEEILDVGAGQGVLAPHVEASGAKYTGVDASPRLIRMARQRHGKTGQFYVGDSRRLKEIKGVDKECFDAAVFLLSVQDMDPLKEVFENVSWALKRESRLVLFMTHPAFRVPRQSGWGWDEGRKLRYRRVDRYLTPLPVPLKPFPGQVGVSRSFHRPLHVYVNGLAEYGFRVDRLEEIPTYKKARGARAKAENLANKEIPLFLGIRARR